MKIDLVKINIGDSYKYKFKRYEPCCDEILDNPCGCGCNLYHLEYDGSEVFTVCNSCGKDIAIIEKNQAKELLKQGSWR